MEEGAHAAQDACLRACPHSELVYRRRKVLQMFQTHLLHGEVQPTDIVEQIVHVVRVCL